METGELSLVPVSSDLQGTPVTWFVVAAGWLHVLFLVYWRILGVKWWWWRWWPIMTLMFARKLYLLYRNSWFTTGEFWDDSSIWLFFLSMWSILEAPNNGKRTRTEVLFRGLTGKKFLLKILSLTLKKKKKNTKTKLNKKTLWREGEVCVSG